MRIIIAEEKHETRYIDASSDELWAKASLALLTEPFIAGYWYHDPSEPDTYTAERKKKANELLAMSEDQINNLPSALQASVRESIRAAKAENLEEG